MPMWCDKGVSWDEYAELVARRLVDDIECSMAEHGVMRLPSGRVVAKEDYEEELKKHRSIES